MLGRKLSPLQQPLDLHVHQLVILFQLIHGVPASNMLEQNLQVRTIRSIDVLFPFRLRGDLDICRLSLVLEKIEGKCEGKKIERKSRMKKTVKRK